MSEVSSVTLDFWVAMARCLPLPTSPDKNIVCLPRLGLHAISVGRHIQIWNGAVRQKVIEEGWEDDGSLWDPHPHLTGWRVVLLIEARGLPAAKVCHKSPHQILMESGVMDNFDKEAVRHCVERLRNLNRYGYYSAKGITLVESREPPTRNGEQR